MESNAEIELDANEAKRVKLSDDTGMADVASSENREQGQWIATCDKIMKKAREDLISAVYDIRFFENDAIVDLSYDLETHEDLESTADWALLRKLVSRVFKPSAYEQEFNTCRELTTQTWVKCLKEHYFDGEESRYDDLDRSAREATQAFVEWWNNHLATIRPHELYQSMDWLSSLLYNNTKNQIAQMIYNQTLQVALEKGAMSTLSFELFEDVVGKIIRHIKDECHLYEGNTLSDFAFRMPYVDKHESVKQLSNYVDQCILHFSQTESKVMVPSFSIIQSSGYGKTRLVTELAKERPVMYVALKHVTHKEYPPETKTLIEQCFTEEPVFQVHEKALHQAINVCWNFFKSNNASPDPLQAAIAYDEWSMERSHSLRKHPAVLKPFRIDDVVVLVIDNARILLEDTGDGIETKMGKLFRFLSDIWATHPVFTILVDSDIRIANISSSRQQVGKNPGVYGFSYNPFVLSCIERLNSDDPLDDDMKLEFMRNIDKSHRTDWITIASDEVWQRIIHGNKSQMDWIKLSSLRSFGRPLWRLHTYNKGNQKMFPNRGFLKNLSMAHRLAALFCRTGTMMSLECEFAKTLVADHMAVVLDSDTMNCSQHVGFVSDPFLALIAREAWKQYGFLEMDLLPAARYAFASRIVEKRILVNFEARILILCILDQLSQEKDECWSKLVDFLKVFDKTIKFDTIPEDAQISILQFLQYSKQITANDLKDLLERRAGALWKNVILLPYWYTKESIKYGYILIQQHELGSASNLSQLFENLEPKNVFPADNSLIHEKYTNTSCSIIMNLSSNTTTVASTSSKLVNAKISSFKLYLYNRDPSKIQELLSLNSKLYQEYPSLPNLPVSSGSNGFTTAKLNRLS